MERLTTALLAALLCSCSGGGSSPPAPVEPWAGTFRGQSAAAYPTFAWSAGPALVEIVPNPAGEAHGTLWGDGGTWSMEFAEADVRIGLTQIEWRVLGDLVLAGHGLVGPAEATIGWVEATDEVWWSVSTVYQDGAFGGSGFRRID